MSETAARLRDWMPIRIYRNDVSTVVVDWCYMGDERFTSPFFNDTIRSRMVGPFNALFRHRTPITSLKEVTALADVIEPNGFIFHMSRCGSTLVTQMLAALRSNIVISEAPPIDSIISSHRRCDKDDSETWLKEMVSVLGRRRHPDERNYFIKFDSWNTLDLGFVRRVFPRVPWVFLYRNPVEVIVSHMRQRGSQMVPGGMDQLMPELSLTKALQMSGEEYCAKILAAFCSTALEHARDENALLVNYDQLPEAVGGAIADHFDVPFDEIEIDHMRAAAQFNAKTPQMFFEPDVARKLAEAGPEARKAAATWVDPIYEQLENIRLSVPR